MNEELRSGRLHAGQIENYQFKNVITRSVGYEKHVAVDIYRRKVQKDDVFLLCTDGLSGLIKMNEITDEINNNGPRYRTVLDRRHKLPRERFSPLGAEQSKSGPKRTFPRKCPLLGVERKDMTPPVFDRS